MKKMSAEKILEYYIKLAKKETKVKKVYIQRKGNTIYFTNGEFIASFAAVRENMVDFLQETFNFIAGGNFVLGVWAIIALRANKRLQNLCRH